MLFLLAPGIDAAVPLELRLQYISSHPRLWTFAWLTWIFAAVSLIYFLVHWGCLLESLEPHRRRGKIVFAVLVGCLGMIPDTLAETLYIGLIPRLAALGQAKTGEALPTALDHIRMWQQNLNMLTGFLGNGLYCIGGMTLTLLSIQVGGFPKKWSFPALLIWTAGFALSAATLLDHHVLLKVATALTMSTFVAWTGGLGIFFRVES
ncbi:MAG: hypothetical protein U1F66_11050 [bacterium]